MHVSALIIQSFLISSQLKPTKQSMPWSFLSFLFAFHKGNFVQNSSPVSRFRRDWLGASEEAKGVGRSSEYSNLKSSKKYMEFTSSIKTIILD